MNWIVLSALLIVYPLFGLSIYWIRNLLAKTQNFNFIVIAPAGISFIIGISILFYSISTM